MKMKKYYPILLSRAEKWFANQKHLTTLFIKVAKDAHFM